MVKAEVETAGEAIELVNFVFFVNFVGNLSLIGELH
jgi:hypothetical protein